MQLHIRRWVRRILRRRTGLTSSSEPFNLSLLRITFLRGHVNDRAALKCHSRLKAALLIHISAHVRLLLLQSEKRSHGHWRTQAEEQILGEFGGYNNGGGGSDQTVGQTRGWRLCDYCKSSFLAKSPSLSSTHLDVAIEM